MVQEELRSVNLFDPGHTIAAELIGSFLYPWEVLPHISNEIGIISTCIEMNFTQVSEGVFVHESAFVAPTAVLHAPCIICADAKVRSYACIRGSVIVGRGCVVGNFTELKNCILFDEAKVPHLSYVGDSILGYRVHLGAGTVLSNLRGDGAPVRIRTAEKDIETGLKKCGSFLGDDSEVGSNAVLNPGTVLGRRSRVFPLVSVRGAHPAGSIIKDSKVVI